KCWPTRAVSTSAALLTRGGSLHPTTSYARPSAPPCVSGVRLFERREVGASNAYRRRHPPPAPILLTLQPSEVRRRHRQRAVVEKATNVLDGLAHVASELGRAVPEDVDAGE